MAQRETYVGIDVSLDPLDVKMEGEARPWGSAHEEAGIAALCTRLAAVCPARIVLEATGGWETVDKGTVWALGFKNTLLCLVIVGGWDLSGPAGGAGAFLRRRRVSVRRPPCVPPRRPTLSDRRGAQGDPGPPREGGTRGVGARDNEPGSGQGRGQAAQAGGAVGAGPGAPPAL